MISANDAWNGGVMALEPSPAPKHHIRSHSNPISTVFISDDNERIYSADGSGLVVITSTRSLRPLTSWKAHTDSLLAIAELESSILTHGRDNKFHVWKCVEEPSSIRVVASSQSLSAPELKYSMDVNALNYCKFSLMRGRDSSSSTPRALIALPNLVESSLADIWSIPSCDRLHAAIGKEGPSAVSQDVNKTRAGIIMALHLFEDNHANRLRLLCAYENGGVALWEYTSDKLKSVEGIGWVSLWKSKLHVESVMAMAVSKDNSFALTISADHLVGRYNLTASSEPSGLAHKTKHPGNASIAIRADGRVCAIGGWDGKIRLYSTRTLKHLGTLTYHRSSCQSLSFMTFQQHLEEMNDDGGDDDFTTEELKERGRWLISGGLDHRVAIWPLMSFEKKPK